MKYFIIINFIILLISCNNNHKRNNVFTKEDLYLTVNNDSLNYNESENSYYDKFGDSSGSLYKFDNKNQLIFYCFLNNKSYPYAEYYNSKGDILKTEGKTSVQTRITDNVTNSYTISFLYSTFRKSNYSILSTTNFGDTLKNSLLKANIFSNIGFFNIVVTDSVLAKKMQIINFINYYDSVKKDYFHYYDTIWVKELL